MLGHSDEFEFVGMSAKLPVGNLFNARYKTFSATFDHPLQQALDQAQHALGQARQSLGQE